MTDRSWNLKDKTWNTGIETNVFSWTQNLYRNYEILRNHLSSIIGIEIFTRFYSDHHLSFLEILTSFIFTEKKMSNLYSIYSTQTIEKCSIFRQRWRKSTIFSAVLQLSCRLDWLLERYTNFAYFFSMNYSKQIAIVKFIQFWLTSFSYPCKRVNSCISLRICWLEASSVRRRWSLGKWFGLAGTSSRSPLFCLPWRAAAQSECRSLVQDKTNFIIFHFMNGQITNFIKVSVPGPCTANLLSLLKIF